MPSRHRSERADDRVLVWEAKVEPERCAHQPDVRILRSRVLLVGFARAEFELMFRHEQAARIAPR
jgi:hypothetical protein